MDSNTRRKNRPNEAPMPDALAYFLTWTTYGTWLPGDERGWVERGKGFQSPSRIRKVEAEAIMTEDACRLDAEQRIIVEDTVKDHCRIRGWELHTVNARSNHVHAVVAANEAPKIVRNQLKAWCTRNLKENVRNRSRVRACGPRSNGNAPIRKKWWTEGGSIRLLDDEVSLESAILYVLEGQDGKRGT